MCAPAVAALLVPGEVIVAHRLSKSRFLAGLQCLKQQWWRVHEPDAPELVPDAKQQVIFDRGTEVGELACQYVPGGVQIDFDPRDRDGAVDATREAMQEGASAIYEACFEEDDVFVAVDILERTDAGWTLIEVKSSTRVKSVHEPDVAIQLHVLRTAGLDVTRVDLMAVNRACTHPDLSDLFTRHDVTQQAEDLQPGLAEALATQREALGGPLPDVAIGEHCRDPFACPFLSRCWPAVPADHVSSLYRGGKKALALQAAGIERIAGIPPETELSETQWRQVRSVTAGQRIIEPGLKEALDRLAGPLGFFDFETVAPAVPRWPGCHPYDAVPVQFVSFVEGSAAPVAWIASHGTDPRPEAAARLLDALAGSGVVLAWNAPFEKRGIATIAEAVPALAADLHALSDRVVDLLPIVRDCVYDPAFAGSFSLKNVLPALVPELSYDGLAIRDGTTASNELERMLLSAEPLPDAEVLALSTDLNAYCSVDTMGLVKMYERLRELAG